MLAQKQKLFKNKIQNNPHMLSGNLYPQIDNGYGSNIENRSGTPTVKTYLYPVRIYRIKKAVKKIVNNEAVYYYEEIYEMQSDSNTIVDVRLEFVYNSMNFKVKSRDTILKFGGIVGYQYELDEITQQEIN